MMDIRWVTHIINDGYMVGYARYEKIDWKREEAWNRINDASDYQWRVRLSTKKEIAAFALLNVRII
jgi:hypothetical protein